MHQKAAICIRTSSEAWGEKASPGEQEADCRFLAKETVNPKIAPIRAWEAQMELESMQERMTMGVIARRSDQVDGSVQ